MPIPVQWNWSSLMEFSHILICYPHLYFVFICIALQSVFEPGQHSNRTLKLLFIIKNGKKSGVIRWVVSESVQKKGELNYNVFRFMMVRKASKSMKQNRRYASLLAKPAAYITHNATWPLSIKSEFWVCYARAEESAVILLSPEALDQTSHIFPLAVLPKTCLQTFSV